MGGAAGAQPRVDVAERAVPPRFLVRDRDAKFSDRFDEVFRSEGIEVLRTPVQAPTANAFAERFVGTIRRECLDWVVILSRRQLERTLRAYVEHYNGHRSHGASGSSRRSTTAPQRPSATARAGQEAGQAPEG